MPHQVFVSYARDDRERVRPIVQALRRVGWKVWWDQDLRGGERFRDVIRQELEHAAAVMVVWSESSCASDWVVSEAEDARKRGVLVTVRIDPVDPPNPFGTFHCVDHFGGGEPTGETLKSFARSLLPKTGQPAARPPKPAKPAAAPAPRRTPPRIEDASVEPAIPAAEPSAPASPPPAPPRATAPAATMPAPTMPAPKARPWRRAAIAAGIAVTTLSSAWMLRTTWARDDAGKPRVGIVRSPTAGSVEFETDEATGSRRPLGWEVVDPTPGVDGWAKRVREPESGIVLQLVEPGEFFMGSPEDEPKRGDDERRHLVRITRPFYLGITEVTEAQVLRTKDQAEGSDYPVGVAEWSEAKAFCARIGCELPTEAQWEYAARAGTTGAWWWGDSPDGGRGKANVFDGVASRELDLPAQFPFDDGYTGPAPVAKFEPNPWGFHDMVGNVWEWCVDDYVAEYGTEPREDPRVEYDGSAHPLRGGSFASWADKTRSARRHATNGSVVPMPFHPDRFSQTGFRVAKNLQ